MNKKMIKMYLKEITDNNISVYLSSADENARTAAQYYYNNRISVLKNNLMELKKKLASRIRNKVICIKPKPMVTRQKQWYFPVTSMDLAEELQNLWNIKFDYKAIFLLVDNKEVERHSFRTKSLLNRNVTKNDIKKLLAREWGTYHSALLYLNENIVVAFKFFIVEDYSEVIQVE